MTAANLLLLLLACVTTVTRASYPGIYIPIGAGEPQEGHNLSKTFGSFPPDFVRCGKRTTDKLNEQFKNMNMEINVHCEPTPTRILIAETGNVDFGTFERKLTEECELLTCSANEYQKEGTELGTEGRSDGATALAPKAERAEMNVCTTRRADYSAGATGNALFGNEDQCWKKEKSLEGLLTSGRFVQVPRWLKAGEERVNLRTVFYRGEKLEQRERVPYTFQPIFWMGRAKFKECATTCDRGSLVKLIMNPNSYRAMVYLKPTCRAFKVCFNPDHFLEDKKLPECNADRMIDVLVHNGAVVWSKRGRASLIEMKSSFHSDAYPVAIEFGYGVNVGGEVRAEFYVGNDHREFVMSDSAGYSVNDTDKLAFFFSQPDCLVEAAGIFSKNIQNGKVLTDTDVNVVGSLYDEKGEPITGPQAEKATKTTTREPVYHLESTTTPSPLRVVPDMVHVEGPMAHETNVGSRASYTEGKWWTWGVYIGFVLGTIVTLVIGAAVFYVMRRTIFAIWYRGMYKRYECDPSGTTGGLSGVGFGATTAEIQTVAETTEAETTTTTSSTGASTTATEATSQSALLGSGTNTLGM